MIVNPNLKMRKLMMRCQNLSKDNTIYKNDLKNNKKIILSFFDFMIWTKT